MPSLLCGHERVSALGYPTVSEANAVRRSRKGRGRGRAGGLSGTDPAEEAQPAGNPAASAALRNVASKSSSRAASVIQENWP